MARTPENFELTIADRQALEALLRSPKTAQSLALRARIVLLSGAGETVEAVAAATGASTKAVTKRHRAKEFLDFLRQIERSTPKELALHIILDNSSTHKTAEIQKWLAGHPSLTLHFTPTSASWLNAVEGWFSQLERRSLYRGVFSSVTELRNEIHRFIEAHNAISAKPFKWTKSASAIIESVQRAKQSANITGKN